MKYSNYVGIVEKVEDNYIYIIEGNSSNECKNLYHHSIKKNTILRMVIMNQNNLI